jgi:uncharacterized protein
MNIPRHYDISTLLRPYKALILFGSRQVGKTTLLEDFLKKTPLKTKLDTGDNIRLRALFESEELEQLREYAEGYDLLAIDEAQRLPKAGECLKIMLDQRMVKYILVTGSSSFELAGQIGEPLTGRKNSHTLYPIAQSELALLYNRYELKEQLPERLVLGSYPAVVTAKSRREKIRILEEITDSYLFKDILAIDKIKNSKILLDLLSLIALQLGSEVSHSELAQQLKIDSKTVARYLDILEKSFILYNLRGFSRNLRSEITKKSKYYFLDNGIRNAVISNFQPLDKRDDVGALWENFLVIERLKSRHYHEISANDYFWRTWEQSEIDLIEERDGALHAYEFKWGAKKAAHCPEVFKEAYPASSFTVINSSNFLDFLLVKP